MAPSENMKEAAAKADKVAAEEKERLEKAKHKAEAFAEERGAEARQGMAKVREKVQEHAPHSKR